MHENKIERSSLIVDLRWSIYHSISWLFGLEFGSYVHPDCIVISGRRKHLGVGWVPGYGVAAGLVTFDVLYQLTIFFVPNIDVAIYEALAMQQGSI